MSYGLIYTALGEFALGRARSSVVCTCACLCKRGDGRACVCAWVFIIAIARASPDARTGATYVALGIGIARPFLSDWCDAQMEPPQERDRKFREHMARVKAGCDEKLRAEAQRET